MRVVDVFGREVLEDRTVLVGDGHILAVLPFADCPAPEAREVVDCKNRPLVPGLMDAHLHIESTMLTPQNFARAVLPCGTTEVVADPHEIANVCGVAGIRYMLDAGRDLPVRIHIALPSCVPCTPFEDAGAVLDARALADLWTEDRVCSLGEVMNVPGVLAGDGDLLAKMEAARASGHVLDGHCPGLKGRALQAYAALGIGNDHEETDCEILKEHIRAGMYVFVREGSAARSLERVLPVVTEANAHRFCFCTDDLHAEDILARGHVNAILARAVRLGLPAPCAVAMATINTAQCYGFEKVGAIAPGYVANLVLLEDLQDFRVHTVWTEGVCRVQEGEVLVSVEASDIPEPLLHSVHLKTPDRASLALAVPSGRARVIGLLPGDLCTAERIMDVKTDSAGFFSPEDNPGLCKIAVLERHKSLGLAGLGILDGYARPGLSLGGALATSISHDSHNIVVAGSRDEDMLLAVQTVERMNGGIALVRNGAVVASVCLPVAGLMSLDRANSPAHAPFVRVG
ncbi:MAG TPA: amidohydrolase family protein [Candidatus Desulfovibrio intestinipullorum]|uniref:Adenine deaminase n=1 Tax=Candidatus Desulfovibrio intestinipullorum TaxID=2838536 RepID=A0A9D1PWY9_9BACT|nr:amidohydrolase family protein [Candidatus Desulfovibrio intestinipullorum]